MCLDLSFLNILLFIPFHGLPWTDIRLPERDIYESFASSPKLKTISVTGGSISPFESLRYGGPQYLINYHIDPSAKQS